VATITGAAGVHLGSYRDICNDESPKNYQVDGVDTRDTMVRQIWGARVLQSGDELPDCEVGGGWTFTLFPGQRIDNPRLAARQFRWKGLHRATRGHAIGLRQLE
jgi:hypothetical protein